MAQTFFWGGLAAIVFVAMLLGKVDQERHTDQLRKDLADKRHQHAQTRRMVKRKRQNQGAKAPCEVTCQCC